MSAKDLIVKPISAQLAMELVKRVHYSGKVVNNSTLHLGVYYNGKLEGAMQFGSPMDRRKSLTMVTGTLWNQMLELNRMAFGEALPRNSESRAMAVAFKMIRKHRPDIKWILSFADATQCGDGAIYRASGFLLTKVGENKTLYLMPNGETVANITLTKAQNLKKTGGASSMAHFVASGAELVGGYQLRYIKFLDPTWLARLTVPVIPFDQIPDDARMYRGQRASAPASQPVPPVVGGAAPTRTLQGSDHAA